MFLGIQKSLISLFTFFMMLYGTIAGINFGDKTSDYIKNVDTIDIVENTIDTALPQTAVYGIIKKHLEDKSGDKVKKAIVIGYDGCRLDALTLINKENSAITDVINDGGCAVVSYCGGKNYPAFNTQETSTGPGWCSMLTGVWANVHGIKGNGTEKSNDHLTLITSAVQDGTIDRSAFYVSWGGHFSGPGGTYYAEKQYVEENGINASFICSQDDDGTLDCTLTDLADENCSDFIFLTLEFTDHAGHGSGYCIKNPEYKKAFAENETYGKTIIDAIKTRPTYENEDWLILITSDHGGYNNDHGFFTLQERMTFIAVNKEIEYSTEKSPVC